MDIYGLLGHPLSHSYSALMHNAAFKHLKMDARYELFEVKPENLKSEFYRLLEQGVKGFNVTIPHKVSMVPLLQELDEFASLTGAVNTIKVESKDKLVGFNTDIPGFGRHLQDLGFVPKGKTIAILGAGGAARAVAMYLAKKKAEKISLYDIQKKRAGELKDKIQEKFPRCETEIVNNPNALLDLVPQLLVNATPIGMKEEDPLVFDSMKFKKGIFIYDLVYNPPLTKLLKTAQERGMHCASGLRMLLYQGAFAFEIWTGKEAPLQIMEEALLEAVKL